MTSQFVHPPKTALSQHGVLYAPPGPRSLLHSTPAQGPGDRHSNDATAEHCSPSLRATLKVTGTSSTGSACNNRPCCCCCN